MGLVAWLLRVFGWRRELVRRHLARCLPELDASRRRDIEAGFYSHLGQLAAEVLAQRLLDPAALANRVRFENPQLVRDCLQATPGRALILSSHHANWEWLLLRCSNEFNEPLTAAYKPTRRESVDGVLRRMRERFGCTMVKARTSCPTCWNSGARCGCWPCLPTSRRRRRASSRPGSSSSASRLRSSGVRAGSVPSLAIRCTWPRCTANAVAITSCASSSLSRAGTRLEPDQILTAYTQALEQHVRQYPELYFWAYNRWKREKPLYG